MRLKRTTFGGVDAHERILNGGLLDSWLVIGVVAWFLIVFAGALILSMRLESLSLVTARHAVNLLAYGAGAGMGALMAVNPAVHGDWTTVLFSAALGMLSGFMFKLYLARGLRAEVDRRAQLQDHVVK